MISAFIWGTYIKFCYEFRGSSFEDHVVIPFGLLLQSENLPCYLDESQEFSFSVLSFYEKLTIEFEGVHFQLCSSLNCSPKLSNIFIFVAFNPKTSILESRNYWVKILRCDISFLRGCIPKFRCEFQGSSIEDHIVKLLDLYLFRVRTCRSLFGWKSEFCFSV